MLRNRKADAQKEARSHYLVELRAKLDEARRFWRESVELDMHSDIVNGNAALYEEAVAAYNAQCEKEGLCSLLRVAN